MRKCQALHLWKSPSSDTVHQVERLDLKMVFCNQNCSDLHTMRKKCSNDREKLLKFETEGQEFAKFLRSLEQFIQTEQFLVTKYIFNLFLEVSHI